MPSSLPRSSSVPVHPVVLLLEVAEGEEGGRVAGAEDEGHPARVGQVAPVRPAGLTQLTGVVTERRKIFSFSKSHSLSVSQSVNKHLGHL